MGMPKFTPGPWSIDPEGLEMPRSASIDAPTHGELALVVWKMDDDERSPENEANAYLIAAAPELYEALHWIVEKPTEKYARLMFGDAQYDMAVAALKKARGEQP